MSYTVADYQIVEHYDKQSERSLYQPFTGKLADRWATGWIDVQHGKEVLQVRIGERTTELHTAVYIQHPAIFAERVLFAAVDEAGDWPLYQARIDAESHVEVAKISQVKGRIQSIRPEASASASWVVYECRIGKQVQIYAAHLDEDGLHADLPVTDGTFNAYDPHIAPLPDGGALVVYSAFIGGNYEIYMQKLGKSGEKVASPQRISGQSGSSFWPSVCSGIHGELWICWSSFSHVRQFEDSYLQHPQYKARRSLFTNLPEIYAVQYDQGQLYVYPHVENREHWNLHRISKTLGGKYPAIIQTGDGRVHLLFTQYALDTMNQKPDMCISSLTPTGWTDPMPVVSPVLHEQFPVAAVDGSELRLAFARDGRSNKEWFDRKNSIEIGCQSLSFTDTGQIGTGKRSPYYVPPIPVPSIEEPEHPMLAVAGERRLIWGQTHCHTNLSVCQRRNDQSIDFNYRFFQDVMKSDFGCVTDHCRNQWLLEQHINHKMADYYYFPGQFIAFAAYEWTGSKMTHEGGPFGHVNCLLLEEKGTMPFFSPGDVNCEGSSLAKLWAAYHGRKIVTIPHHTSDGNHYYNWSFFDPEHVPVVEVFQDCRGQHEHPGVWGTTPYHKVADDSTWVLAALKRGYKLGMIGAGDHSGIARGAVEVKELTRSALYDGLMSKRTYASTGTGADVHFSANGEPAGSTLRTQVAEFRLEIASAVPIAQIEILKDGEIQRREDIRLPQAKVVWKSVIHEGSEFWHCRALLENGEVVWTSPIWIEC